MNRKDRRKAASKKVKLPQTSNQEIKKPILGDRLGLRVPIAYENVRKKSLFIATPCYGGMTTGIYTRSLLNLTEKCREFGITATVHFLFNESLVQRGRNYCADEFMRARIGPPPPPILDKDNKPLLDEKGEIVFQEDKRPFFTHMLFIDADIQFDPMDIIFMLAIADPGTDKDIICGPYPKKTISWEKIKLAVDRGFADKDPKVLERFVGDYVFNPKGGTQIKLNEPFEILEGGTGMMLIQRQAFEKFSAMFPTQSYKPDHVRTKHFDGSREIFAYFDCPIDRGYTFQEAHDLMQRAADGEDVAKEMAELLEKEKTASKRYLSEDYYFCQMVQKAGAKVWFIPWMKTAHAGSYIFGGSVLDLAQLGANFTADPSQLKEKK